MQTDHVHNSYHTKTPETSKRRCWPGNATAAAASSQSAAKRCYCCYNHHNSCSGHGHCMPTGNDTLHHASYWHALVLCRVGTYYAIQAHITGTTLHMRAPLFKGTSKAELSSLFSFPLLFLSFFFFINQQQPCSVHACQHTKELHCATAAAPSTPSDQPSQHHSDPCCGTVLNHTCILPSLRSTSELPSHPQTMLCQPFLLQLLKPKAIL